VARQVSDDPLALEPVGNELQADPFAGMLRTESADPFHPFPPRQAGRQAQSQDRRAAHGIHGFHRLRNVRIVEGDEMTSLFLADAFGGQQPRIVSYAVPSGFEAAG